MKILKLIAFILLVSSSVLAEAPQDLVRRTVDEVKRVVMAGQEKNTQEEIDAKVRDVVSPVFDFEEMSRRSLGPNWKKGTPEQRKEFVSVFSELLAKTYLKRIRNNALTSEVKILNSDVDENKALVRTVAISDGDDITVDYRMRMRNNKWTIYDIIIANVGLVSNYRSEFSGIVSNEGFAGLISRLREKHLSNDDEQS